ncbi:MAG: thioredoxin domain-containing protein [Magnetococcales bacterium]|nr:thioredoxin domain-containing protein [Magnetococcales bacterium]
MANPPKNPTNRLIHETSPYLLQHAHNPVNWYPWGEEALKKAKEEGKPILVSIGYAACHWCHVMERESFEDTPTAKLLNQHYIAIKVDREERPDLDGHFMDILTTMTGSGGWPLNLILTPDLKPIYGGTYFPPESRHGLPAFKEMLGAIHNAWINDRDDLEKRISGLSQYLEERIAKTIVRGASKSEVDFSQKAAEFWTGRFDPEYGGFGEATKFPQPSILSFLLRQTAVTGDATFAEMSLMTLDRMAASGMRDQLAGSFHRYAVDRRWMVPHFEIMLYDNALLARLYLEAYRLTGETRYGQVARDIFDDFFQRFRFDDNTFASSLDADSEGEEGLYYTWTEAEVKKLLNKKGREVEAAARADDFLERFVDPFEGLVDDRSVLRYRGEDPVGFQNARDQVADDIQILLKARESRIPPARDDKILTSWNALMVSALAQGGAVLGEPKYLEAAQKALDSLMSSSVKNGQLRHTRLGKKVGEGVFLDDYAFVIQAHLDLYEAAFDLQHLETARKLAHEMLDRFQPATGTALHLTPLDVPRDIPVRVELEDGAVPSGNAVALISLKRLALLTLDPRLEKEGHTIAEGLGQYLERSALSATELLGAWHFGEDQAREVIVTGPPADPATQALLHEIRSRFLPGVVVALNDPGVAVDHDKWPLFPGRAMLEDKPTAYVCRNRVCRLPVTDPKDLAALLTGGGDGADQLSDLLAPPDLLAP